MISAVYDQKFSTIHNSNINLTVAFTKLTQRIQSLKDLFFETIQSLFSDNKPERINPLQFKNVKQIGPVNTPPFYLRKSFHFTALTIGIVAGFAGVAYYNQDLLLEKWEGFVEGLEKVSHKIFYRATINCINDPSLAPNEDPLSIFRCYRYVSWDNEITDANFKQSPRLIGEIFRKAVSSMHPDKATDSLKKASEQATAKFGVAKEFLNQLYSTEGGKQALCLRDHLLYTGEDAQNLLSTCTNKAIPSTCSALNTFVNEFATKMQDFPGGKSLFEKVKKAYNLYQESYPCSGFEIPSFNFGSWVPENPFRSLFNQGEISIPVLV